jgi:hypothetical protein
MQQRVIGMRDEHENPFTRGLIEGVTTGNLPTFSPG